MSHGGPTCTHSIRGPLHCHQEKKTLLKVNFTQLSGKKTFKKKCRSLKAELQCPLRCDMLCFMKYVIDTHTRHHIHLEVHLQQWSERGDMGKRGEERLGGLGERREMLHLPRGRCWIDPPPPTHTPPLLPFFSLGRCTKERSIKSSSWVGGGDEEEDRRKKKRFPLSLFSVCVPGASAVSLFSHTHALF